MADEAEGTDSLRTISDVAEELNVPNYVLRFWEGKFPQVAPQKGAGGRRYYSPETVEVLKKIHRLLYEKGYTVKGAQQALLDDKADLSRRNAAEAVSAGTDGVVDLTHGQLARFGGGFADIVSDLRELKEFLADA